MSKLLIVGAGPGDPKLLTLAAYEALKIADVVLYDRLVSEDILCLANDTAEKIYVGKHRGEQDVKQEDIYAHFVRFAQQNKTIVRLKGGDPLVFGRGGEEWLFAKELGCEVELIPGISSALGVPGIAGIPLTIRDISRSFAVVTGHCCGDSPTDWSKYSGVDTLVILMGIRDRAIIAQSLIDAGRAAKEPVAFVENGSCDNQKVVRSNLSDVASGVVEVNAPAVFVVGAVTKFLEETTAQTTQGVEHGQRI